MINKNSIVSDLCNTNNLAGVQQKVQVGMHALLVVKGPLHNNYIITEQ